MKYIDIHSHLNFHKFNEDLPKVLSRMKEREVGTILIGVDKKTSKEVLDIAKQNENIWACIGFHPVDSDDDFDEDFLEELIKDPKVVAIGECGLDYFRLGENNPQMNADEKQAQINADKEKQKKLFEQQIDFAAKHNLPLMLHVRSSNGTEDAHLDVIEILKDKKEKYGEALNGNSHFFTSSKEIAQRYFDLGFTISFTGIITYVRDFDELIKSTPIDMVHAETDSPFAAPVPHRNERNEPSYVIEVVKKIAEIKGLSEGELREKLLLNANRLFNLRA